MVGGDRRAHERGGLAAQRGEDARGEQRRRSERGEADAVAGPGVCVGELASASARSRSGCAGGRCAGPSRSTARAMRRTAVSDGGAEAWPPSPRADEPQGHDALLADADHGGAPGTKGSGASTTAPPSSTHEPRHDRRVRGGLRRSPAAARAVGLLVAAEREVDVAGRHEARRPAGSRPPRARRSAVPCRRGRRARRPMPSAMHPVERRMGPGVALVDRNDVVVRHQHDGSVGCRGRPIQRKSRPNSVCRSRSSRSCTSG